MNTVELQGRKMQNAFLAEKRRKKESGKRVVKDSYQDRRGRGDSTKEEQTLSR